MIAAPPTDRSAGPISPSIVEDQLRNLLLRIRAITEAQEAGAAQTPLTDQVDHLMTSNAAICVVLASLTPAAQQAALRAILGSQAAYHLCKIIAPDGIGYLELDLRERGFILESGRSRQEFDSLEMFLGALQACRHVDLRDGGEGLIEPLRIGLASPVASDGMHLILLQDADVLVRRPEVSSAICHRAEALLLSGESPGEPLPLPLREALSTVLQHVSGLQTIVISRDGSNSSAAWTHGLRAPLQFPAVHLAETDDDAAASASPDLLGAPATPRRALLRLHGRLADGEQLVFLIRSHIEEEQAYLLSQKQSREAALAEGGPQDDSSTRATMESLAASLAEELKLLIQHQEDRMRLLMHKRGRFFELLGGASSQISATSVETEQSEKQVQVHLRPEVGRGVAGHVLEDFLSYLNDLESTVNEATHCVAESFMNQFKGQESSAPMPRLKTFRTNRIRDLAEALLSDPPDVRTDYGQQSIGARIWQYFQIPTMIFFTLTMPLSLVTQNPLLEDSFKEIAKDTRGFLMFAVLIPLYVAIPFFMERTYRRDQDQLFVKAIDKIRDTMRTDLDRTIKALLEDTKRGFAEYVGEVGGILRKEIDSHFSGAMRQKQMSGQQQKDQAQKAIRGLDRRLQELNTRRQQLDQISQEFRRLRSQVEGDFTKAA